MVYNDNNKTCGRAVLRTLPTRHERMGSVDPQSTRVCDSLQSARFIRLTHGMFAVVDAADYASLSAFNWYYFTSANRQTGYAVRATKNVNTKTGHTNIRMHRQILVVPPGIEIDHINGDGLDNRRCNLRVATTIENARNRPLRRDNQSGYKGVYWSKEHRVWRASIRVNKRLVYLGSFETKVLAAHAYDRAALEHFGAFARINFPGEVQS